MPSNLGLYIENNIIKYAKVSKEHDNFKVEAFGMKFYDNIEDAVKQIIDETYSYRNTTISTNLSNEKYYISPDLFKLLNAKDLKKAVKTEFDFFCEENHKTKNALEFRNILAQNLQDKDKYISVFAYTEKSDIAKKSQILSGHRLTSITPLPISIANLLRSNNNDNKAIINIEKNTTVTFLVDNKVYGVEQIDIGMKNILDSIMMKENSYAKAYEICKNTTIYTSQGRNLQIEENEYMEDIMPTLYRIVERVKEIVLSSGIDVKELYITGLATSINNIDLYFQENFPDKRCEVLVPFFVQKSNIKLNIKDYIEVNSAIALALHGLGIGLKEMNFKEIGTAEKIRQTLNIESRKSSKKAKTNDKKDDIKNKIASDFSIPLDFIEINMRRTLMGILVLLVMYSIFTGIVSSQINMKEKQVDNFISESRNQIAKVVSNKQLVKERENQYRTMIERIDEANNKLTESYRKKNVLPNFLTEIMFNIPKDVQLTSIENTAGKTVKIIAKSREYEQLGYFIAKIKNEAILTEVTSTSGTRVDDFVEVTIQGKLPY